MVSYEWFDKEESYLKQLHDMCLHQSHEYMTLYRKMHATQTKLRLPAIVMSSISGVASFGTSGFPSAAQRYVNIAVGVINITIAMIQTYESYLKIGDIVTKSLTVATSLKKLADDIYCEIFLPIEDRETAGITFLRDCFGRYQAIIDNAPPLPVKDATEDINKTEKHKNLIQDINVNLKNEERIEFGKTFRRTTIRSNQSRNVSQRALRIDHVYPPPLEDDEKIDVQVRQVIGDQDKKSQS